MKFVQDNQSMSVKVYCVDFTSRSSIHRVSSFVQFAVVCLM